MLYKTTEQHEAFRKKVREFAEKEVKPITFELDQNNQFPDEIVKRMGETRFAAGANREAMWAIENTGIEFEDFAKLSLDAMKEISDVLGL